jgi:hypothetical protein
MSALPTSAPRRGALRASHLRQVSNGSAESPFSNRRLTAASEAGTSQNDPHPTKPTVERRCIIWVHDEAFSKDEVVLNLDLFPDVKAGELMAIVALKTSSGVRDFQEKAQSEADNLAAATSRDRSSSNPRNPTHANGEVKHDLDLGKRYLFVAKGMPKDLKSKNPALEISVSKYIADAFCFKHRSNVLLILVCNLRFWLYIPVKLSI